MIKNTLIILIMLLANMGFAQRGYSGFDRNGKFSEEATSDYYYQIIDDVKADNKSIRIEDINRKLIAVFYGRVYDKFCLITSLKCPITGTLTFYDENTERSLEMELVNGILKISRYYSNGRLIKTVGCVVGDCQNGYGQKGFSDGSFYFGNFKNGRLEGYGTLRLSNGKTLMGNFHDNRFISER